MFGQVVAFDEIPSAFSTRECFGLFLRRHVVLT